jgi:hypothetical protein
MIMNTDKLFKLLALTMFVLTQACSGSSSPDPTSREALTKAKPLKWGTTCVEHDSSSYDTGSGSFSTTTTTQQCKYQVDCKTLDASPDRWNSSGGVLNSDTSFTDVKYFEGTCDDQHPVSCDDRKRNNNCDACQYDKCCAFVALCEDDPNCTAIVDCIDACKDDQACAQRCVNNGDRIASTNLTAAVTCLESNCKDRC